MRVVTIEMQLVRAGCIIGRGDKRERRNSSVAKATSLGTLIRSTQ